MVALKPVLGLCEKLLEAMKEQTIKNRAPLLRKNFVSTGLDNRITERA
jgi:hypothetical protein